MTINQAEEIIILLKKGKEFLSRHQEDEWGLRFVSDDCFEKWSTKPVELGGEGREAETLNEIEVTSLLTEWYSYNTILSHLK